MHLSTHTHPWKAEWKRKEGRLLEQAGESKEPKQVKMVQVHDIFEGDYVQCTITIYQEQGKKFKNTQR